jgi:hypothetical protein
MFDRYIGLGLDCEVVVQLRRITGNTQANVFDWQLLVQRSLLHVLRTDFADYFQLPSLAVSDDRRHVVDTATGLQFHHLFTQNFDGTILPQRMVREYPQVRARADYLLDRWRQMVSSTQSVLYVRRDPDGELTLDDMVSLRDALRGCYPSHRFALLWAREGVVADGITELAEGIHVAGVPVPRPRDTFWQGDDTAWDLLYPALRELSVGVRL